jgi:hypothetical protein
MASQAILDQVMSGLRRMDDSDALALRDQVNRQLFRAENPSGRCEDFPCCGHEPGDCDGSLYGSDESIKMQVEEVWRSGHGYCDHQNGIYECESDEDEGGCDD